MKVFIEVLIIILLGVLIVTIPYCAFLFTKQHDARMLDSIVACHTAYTNYTAYCDCAKPYREMMINRQKLDPSKIERDFTSGAKGKK